MNDAETLAAIRERDAATDIGSDGDAVEEVSLGAHDSYPQVAADRRTLLALLDAEAARHREVVAALRRYVTARDRYMDPDDTDNTTDEFEAAADALLEVARRVLREAT